MRLTHRVSSPPFILCHSAITGPGRSLQSHADDQEEPKTMPGGRSRTNACPSRGVMSFNQCCCVGERERREKDSLGLHREFYCFYPSLLSLPLLLLSLQDDQEGHLWNKRNEEQNFRFIGTRRCRYYLLLSLVVVAA